MLIDQENSSQNSCTPWDQTYDLQDILAQMRSIYSNNRNEIFTPPAVNNICDLNFDPITDSCKNLACKAEIWFVLNLVVTEAKYPGQVNPQFQKSSGFDHKFECTSVLPKNENVERSCCGEYPSRHPYKLSNFRKCCGDKTYNSDLFTCCDGEVKDQC